MLCQFLLYMKVNQLYVYICCCYLVTEWCPTLSGLHRLQPTRQASQWDFPDRNTEVGCHFLLQGFFWTQGSNLHLLHWQAGSLPLSHRRSPMFIYIPSFFLFPPHLGHCKALSSVPCATQQVLISYLFYIQNQQCIYVNPNLQIPPTSPSPYIKLLLNYNSESSSSHVNLSFISSPEVGPPTAGKGGWHEKHCGS